MEMKEASGSKEEEGNVGTTGHAYSQCSLKDHWGQNTDSRDPPILSNGSPEAEPGNRLPHPLQSFVCPLDLASSPKERCHSQTIESAVGSGVETVPLKRV